MELCFIFEAFDDQIQKEIHLPLRDFIFIQCIRLETGIYYLWTFSLFFTKITLTMLPINKVNRQLATGGKFGLTLVITPAEIKGIQSKAPEIDIMETKIQDSAETAENAAVMVFSRKLEKGMVLFQGPG